MARLKRIQDSVAKRWIITLAIVWLISSGVGCNSLLSGGGWLTPSIVGNYKRDTVSEIRTSLTLQDTPPGIAGATSPTREDMEAIAQEYPISAGDRLSIQINDLFQRDAAYLTQVQVSPTGQVNIPTVGRVPAATMTAAAFEAALVEALQVKGILVDPVVTVDPLFLQKATYSIFGIGVSAANNAPLRAGTFPISRPDLDLLEAINQVGGLSEFVTDIYIFRTDEIVSTTTPTGDQDPPPPPSGGEALGDGQPTPEPSIDPIDELLRAGDAEPANVDSADDQGAFDPAAEIREAIEQDPTPAYVWINDEYVPNPAYSPQTPEAAATAEAVPVDSLSPSVNWARVAGDSSYRIIHIAAGSLREGDPQSNIFIRAGDVIRIVSGEIGVFYMMGQTNRVGPFAFNAESITLKRAIAIAGGLSGLAWPDRCTIYRRIGGSREQMIQVNLDRIFAGKDPDFLIRRGDIINVGTHPFAPFLQRIRVWTLPTPVNTVGYSFTYSRNFADIDAFGARANPKNVPDRFPLLFP